MLDKHYEASYVNALITSDTLWLVIYDQLHYYPRCKYLHQVHAENPNVSFLFYRSYINGNI